MLKKIRFNLLCDGKSIRDLESLQENFSIEDILGYYKNGLLHRWLSVRSYKHKLSQVENIDVEDDFDIVKELISIFEIEADDSKIRESLYILEYQEERRKLIENYKEAEYRCFGIIKDYHSKYNSLLNEIIENKDDKVRIKVIIKSLYRDYKLLFEMNFRTMFYMFLQKAPLAIFYLLANREVRNNCLPILEENKDNSDVFEIDAIKIKDQKEMYQTIQDLVSDNFQFPDNFQTQTDEEIKTLKLKDILEDNLKEFSGDTDSYWKDIETKDKKILILKIEEGDYVRGTGDMKMELGSHDVENIFPIIDGIDYKSNNKNHKLLYMEV